MPSKKKSSLYQNKTTPEQFQYLLKNDIKVYAVSVKYSTDWQVEVSILGRKKRFDKKVRQDAIQEAIDKTMLFYYDKLIKGNR